MQVFLQKVMLVIKLLLIYKMKVLIFFHLNPIATPQTIAKDPSQVEQMGGFEAIGRAFLPQEMESPAETVARQQAESNRIQLEESSKELAASKGISQEDAKKEILKGIQTDFYYEAVDEIGLTTDTKAVDEEATKKVSSVSTNKLT
jgi:hypothetical protein